MIVVRFVGARGTNGMNDASTTPDPDALALLLKRFGCEIDSSRRSRPNKNLLGDYHRLQKCAELKGQNENSG